jgi:hypothetical protein
LIDTLESYMASNTEEAKVLFSGATFLTPDQIERITSVSNASLYERTPKGSLVVAQSEGRITVVSK